MGSKRLEKTRHRRKLVSKGRKRARSKKRRRTTKKRRRSCVAGMNKFSLGDKVYLQSFESNDIYHAGTVSKAVPVFDSYSVDVPGEGEFENVIGPRMIPRYSYTPGDKVQIRSDLQDNVHATIDNVRVSHAPPYQRDCLHTYTMRIPGHGEAEFEDRGPWILEPADEEDKVTRSMLRDYASGKSLA